jgi:hypothetical protein
MTGTGTQACWPPAVLPNSAGRWTNKQVMELNPQHPWAPDPANMKQPRGGWDEVSQNPKAKEVTRADRNWSRTRPAAAAASDFCGGLLNRLTRLTGSRWGTSQASTVASAGPYSVLRLSEPARVFSVLALTRGLLDSSR